MATQTYRACTPGEITVLEQAGCRADDWRRVSVADPFDAKRLRDVVFEGDVCIGRMGGVIRCRDGVERPPEIARVVLRNVTIGGGNRITNVAGALTNLDIGDYVEIRNVGSITCTGESSFGNGRRIEVLNEGGGRELPITTRTSAQTAYLHVAYRHDTALVKALDAIAERHTAQCRRARATIGTGAGVLNCGEIVDVCIGDAAVVNGALRLRDGSIESSPKAPTNVGAGVVAEHFIIQRGASIKDGAMLFSSLLGEAAQAGKQCSIENSALFANSECFHSELCSVFAGPYTVTHHRSTLLIAGMFSFFNAGSATNQSNHMYKLGPLHQGVLERGCKTGSSSYLLWPARVGAFTVVIGKHYAHFDTSELPFSYLSDDGGKSVLVPAMNLFTVGTMRDAAKWPARDRRTCADPLDRIVFSLLSPYTMQRVLAGRAALSDLLDKSDREREFVTFKGVHIKRLLLKTCARYYTLALQKYCGDQVLARVNATAPTKIRTVLEYAADGAPGDQPWVDLCGLLCPRSRADELTKSVASGAVASFEDLHGALGRIHGAYAADEWNWFLATYRKEHGKELATESPEALRQLVDEWASSSEKLLQMVLQDAQKEFDDGAKVGFGIDGDIEADFTAVRGTFDKNSFVVNLRQQLAGMPAARERLLNLI